jgi:hypothetical protein
MLHTFPHLNALVTGVDINRIPSGQGIDFLVWPLMIGAFAYIVYLTTRKNPSEKGNKEEEK